MRRRKIHLEQFRRADDDCQRILEIVRSDAEKLVLFLIQAGQLIVGCRKFGVGFTHFCEGTFAATLKDHPQQKHEHDQPQIASRVQQGMPFHVVGGIHFEAQNIGRHHARSRHERHERPQTSGFASDEQQRAQRHADQPRDGVSLRATFAPAQRRETHDQDQTKRMTR